MHLLRSLLGALTEDEVSHLQELTLRGKQRRAVELLLSDRNRNTKTNLVKVLQLSESHLYELGSVLLQKIYAHFAPEGFYQLTNFLLDKSLYKHLIRLLRNTEKKLLSAQPDERNRFYRIAFEQSLHILPKERPCPLIKRFADGYLQTLDDRTKADELYTEILILRAQLHDVVVGKDLSKATFGALRRRLERYAAELLKYPSKQAQYAFHRAFTDYYIFIEPIPSALKSHLTHALELVDPLPPVFAENERRALQRIVPYALYAQGEFEESFALYKSVFSTSIPKLLPMYYIWHYLKYAEVASLCGSFDLAIDILKTIEANGLRIRDQSVVTSANVRLTVIYILQGKIDTALETLHRANKSNQGKFYMLIDDLRLRYIESIISYLNGDWLYTQTVITRALQFLRSKEKGLSESDEGYYFKYIEAIMEHIEINKPISVRLQQHFQTYTKGQFRFFGQLLEFIQTPPEAIKK